MLREYLSTFFSVLLSMIQKNYVNFLLFYSFLLFLCIEPEKHFFFFVIYHSYKHYIINVIKLVFSSLCFLRYT